MKNVRNPLRPLVVMAAVIITNLWAKVASAGPIGEFFARKVGLGEEYGDVQEGLTVIQHVFLYVQQTTWRDVTIGRSLEHAAVIWMVTIGWGFLSLSDWEEESKTRLSWKMLKGYLGGVVAGGAYECFRNYNASWAGDNITKAGLALAGFLFLGGIVVQFQIFSRFFQAIKVKRVRYYIRYRRLEPDAGWDEGDLEVGDKAPDSGPTATEAPSSTAHPEPTTSPTSAEAPTAETKKPADDAEPKVEPKPKRPMVSYEPPPSPRCPACRALVREGDRFCGSCAEPLGPCPRCGKKCPPGSNFCGKCMEPLRPSADTPPEDPPQSGTRKRACTKGLNAWDDAF